jgi:hypothetical protein
MRRTRSVTTWAFLLFAFLGIATASGLLAGCGDDSGNDSILIRPE